MSFGSNMHIILYVFEVIEVKSGFKIFLEPQRLFRGHNGFRGHQTGIWKQYANGFVGFRCPSKLTAGPFSLPLSPQVYRAIALLFH